MTLPVEASVRGTGEPPHPDNVPSERYSRQLSLFGLTLVSVFFTGASMEPPSPNLPWYEQWWSGWTYAVPLLLILGVHETGHYVASKLHRVPASLPYFIPAPVLSPFGTMGAVIIMRDRIRSAKALLDIGAAGPLAGMAVAIPMMIWGLHLSPIVPRAASGFVQEGQSLLYFALKWLVFGPIPSTHDVHIHPTAFAAWAGFFVTFLNLLPFSQLDGGHVAFALFGKRHHTWSKRMWLMPLALLVYNAMTIARPALVTFWNVGYEHLTREEVDPALSSTSVWFGLTVLVLIITRYSGGEHPPVDDSHLGIGRRIVAVLTLLLFVLLFMPAPFVQY